MARKGRASSRKGEKNEFTRGFGYVMRCLPMVGLPLIVGGLHSDPFGQGLPLVLLALAGGVAIAAWLPQLRFSAPAFVVLAFLLVSWSRLQDLQAAAAEEAGGHPSASVLGGLAVKGPVASASSASSANSASDGNRMAMGGVHPGAPGPVLPAVGAGSASSVAAAGSAASAPVDPMAAQRVAALRGRAGPSWPASLETLSVVLPCAFEGNFAVQTVRAVWERTVKRRLKEIIVVDDGSNPPLRGLFPSEYLSGGQGMPPVKIIRHERTKGLIGAKKAGGDAATGDVIVFFDCHISPREGWEEAFLRQMKLDGDHRTVVVPTITSLDPETWKEIMVGGSAGKACYVLWNADFTWLNPMTAEVPLMSGGLLAMSRQWWHESGGYDEHMIAWGGENIDQSIRIWLCGGRIQVADGAFVAHMWRDFAKPITRLKYPIPTMDVMRNKARAVSAWFQDFKEKVFTYPEYEMFSAGTNSIGTMSNFEEIRSRLQCAPFLSYIQHFSYVYLDSGLIPEEVYQLREERTGLCLERTVKPDLKPPHAVVLAPCGGGEGAPPAELQIWHPTNRKDGKCCGGLNNWNFLQCLDAPSVGTQVHTGECEIAGFSPNQKFSLAENGDLQWNQNKGCLVHSVEPVGDAGFASKEACSTTIEAVGPDTVSAAGGPMPKSFRLRSGDACASGSGDPMDNCPGARLQFLPCDTTDDSQLFHPRPQGQNFEIRAGDGELCLDAAGGGNILAYPCYPENVHNNNQAWRMVDSKLLWAGNPRTGLFVNIVRKGEIQGQGLFKLRTCVPKRGQRLQKFDARGDGTFLLRDADKDGACLAIEPPSSGGGRGLRLGNCDESERWQELQQSEQVQHVASRLCLDTAAATENYEASPLLFQCHSPKASFTQRWTLVDTPGWLKHKQDWGDNGRKRFFEKCLDYEPVQPMRVVVQPCSRARQLGTRWSRILPFKPLERRLYEEALAKYPGGSLPALGGGRKRDASSWFR